jgi:hypothetical protein
LLKRKREKREMPSKLSRESLKSYKTKSRVTKLRPKSFRSSSISLKRTSKSMVLKHLKQMLSIISA